MRYKTKTLILTFALGVALTIPCAPASGTEVHSDRSDSLSSEPDPRPPAMGNRPKKKKKPHRCDTRVDASYKKMVDRLREVPDIPGPRYQNGYRDLVFYAPATGDRVRLFPYRRNGTLNPNARKKIRRIFKDHDTGAKHEIHPRLIALLYKLADHFESKQITVISGYRETKVKGGESRHNEGKAVDFLLPGVPLKELAQEARKLGHVGVGHYPTSHFVHLDVRKKTSVFWVDASGPKKRGCRRRVMRKAAARYDRGWEKRADKPEPRRNKRGILLGETNLNKRKNKQKRHANTAHDNHSLKGKPGKSRRQRPEKAPNIAPY